MSSSVFFVNRRMKLEQIKVAQIMQTIFITSLKLSEFEDLAILSALFIANKKTHSKYA